MKGSVHVGEVGALVGGEGERVADELARQGTSVHPVDERDHAVHHRHVVCNQATTDTTKDKMLSDLGEGQVQSRESCGAYSRRHPVPSGERRRGGRRRARGA